MAILGLLLLSSFSFMSTDDLEEKRTLMLLTTDISYEAGSQIDLQFSSSTETTPPLYCSNSYGSTIIIPTLENNVLHYKIPSHLSYKSGLVNWTLVDKDASLLGQFQITSKQHVAHLETYIGPPNIGAGGTDYTMLVVIPTDTLDNPLKNNTLVQVQHQFLSNEKSEQIWTKHCIAYKNIYSEQSKGRILIASECLNVHSKEYSVEVMAGLPTNFSISANRNHHYADGNQITTFKTSVLKDKLGNIVSDGTYVEFYITTGNGNILMTFGSTIQGVATAKMLHPDHGAEWIIKAFIDGIAESNTVTLNYMKAIKDFEVAFSENNRSITIGPLQSFMKQMIPEGLQVKLLIYQDHQLIKTIIKNSNLGYSNFNLNLDSFTNGSYELKIKVAGLEKTFKTVILW